MAPLPLVLFAMLLVIPVVVATIVDDDGLSTSPDNDGSVPSSSTSEPFVRPPIEPAGVEPGPEDPPPISGSVASYRIVYAVDGYGPAGSVADTEIHEVRRPFESRVETRVGTPPGEAISSLTIHGFGYTVVGDGGDVGTPLINEPTLPLGDVGVAADLAGAIEAGVMRYLAQMREVIGRTCHRYRTGSTIDVAVLTPPTESDFADLCIDSDGLVLSESWVVDGELFRRRTAVDLVTGPDLDDDRFVPLGDAPQYADGGGLISRVTDDSEAPEVDHWWLPATPEGLTHRGRYGFAAPTATTSADDDEPVRVVGLVDVYQSATDAVIVVNAGSTDRSDVLGDLGEHTVELGELGEAAARRRIRGAELLVPLSGGRLVRIHGTLSLDDLVALAGTLERSPADPDNEIVADDSELLIAPPSTTVPDHDHDDADPDDHDHDHGSPTDHTHS